MCIKDMIKDMSCYELERSVTARMGISKNKEILGGKNGKKER